MMPKPIPGASQLAPCPLSSAEDAPPKHLVWRDVTGWIVVYGTPRVWTLVAAGLPRWHMAKDAASRRWLYRSRRRGMGWSSPVFRLNDGFNLPDGQTVCDVCWRDLTGGAR